MAMQKIWPELHEVYSLAISYLAARLSGVRDADSAVRLLLFE